MGRHAAVLSRQFRRLVDRRGAGRRVLINDLKAAGVHVWGLSNWQKDLFPIALDNFDILRSLDDRVVSGYVSLRKPNKDIYEFALQQFGIELPARCSWTIRP